MRTSLKEENIQICFHEIFICLKFVYKFGKHHDLKLEVKYFCSLFDEEQVFLGLKKLHETKSESDYFKACYDKHAK